MHAPLFHPALKAVGPIRKELGMKTFFNLIGPIVNPANPQNQLTGVYSLETVRLYNYLFQKTDKNFSIVYSLDGYDEISLTSNFKVVTNNDDIILSPEKVGMKRLSEEQLFGGNTVEEAAIIFKSVLSGEGSIAQNNVVLINSAMAIKTICPLKSIESCIEEAKDSLLGKKAAKVFEKVIE